MTDETYESIMAKLRRLGICAPDDAVNYSLRVVAQLADEVATGGHLLVERQGDVKELMFPYAPARTCGQPPLLEHPVREQDTRRLRPA
jgi:hypothetical protein